ncbi:hypothetical protein AB0A76_32345 [Streptomyces exfoliatus]|uniref:Uncharacterized protein n=1 Tax=Streptomyces exfoliatus TaxID=1905 RepID=A0ABV3D5U7_STREX
MTTTGRALRASSLPVCWSSEFDALSSPRARALACEHTVASVDRMPAAYRYGIAVALRLFPFAFRLSTGHRPDRATPAQIRHGMARLRVLPGYGEVLRATTALALYGALDGAVPGNRDTSEGPR